MDSQEIRAATWVKSSYSGNNGGDCIEVALAASGALPVRDSKVPDGPYLMVPAAAWSAFVDLAKDMNV
ncbi:DUF397 domain-containing protein [Streptomyces sp. NPDC017056]|uniref:DUF397 domain-containing protein n=1 Tax=Streptomyces sp. NPDC017056 TaxID=3364973 RepID=UPI00379EAAEE